MIKAATVGVDDHTPARVKPRGRSRNLINKAAPTDKHSTSTEKMAALLVSASFVNIPETPSILAEETARRSCPTAGRKLGSWPGSRRGAGSGPGLLRDVHVARNGCILLLSEVSVCALGHKGNQLRRTPLLLGAPVLVTEAALLQRIHPTSPGGIIPCRQRRQRRSACVVFEPRPVGRSGTRGRGRADLVYPTPQLLPRRKRP